MSVHFLKLYNKIEAGELLTDSLIAYGKHPLCWETRPVKVEAYSTSTDSFTHIQTVETVVTEYAHRLFVNLWFVHLFFKWTSKR